MTLTRAQRRAEKQRRPLLRSLRLWVPVGIVLVLMALAAVAAVVGKQVYGQAMAAKSSLEQAIPLASKAANQVIAGDNEGANATTAQLTKLTADAKKRTSGELWKSLEWVPVAGPNLHAIRTVATVTDDLVTEVLAPATELSLDALKPVNGRVDLGALERLAPVINRVSTGLDTAHTRLSPIRSGDLIPQVADGVDRLKSMLTDARPPIETLRNVISVLPDALGASGPRNYLLVFQGNSEARSLGGNAAAFIMMRAEKGALTVTRQVSSIDFPQGLPEPVARLDPQAVAIYGNKIGRYTPDLTMVPDFPTATEILKGWWRRGDLPAFDSVLSLDPVALSYLLKATGPVTLATGDVLTADNAAPLLLNEVYFRYSDFHVQDAFFASAADAIFGKITTGNFAPKPFFAALTHAADEGRLLYRSSDERENDLISQMRVSGIMPTDSSKQTAIGVYVNDNTGSKMSYYMDMSVSVCRTTAGVSGTVSLTSNIRDEEAKKLPRYITGPYFAPGDISTYLVLYGPPGTKLAQVTIDGAPATILASGEHLGRPAVKIDVRNHLVSAHAISFAFVGLAADSGPLAIWHTPMVRDTKTEVAPSCS